MAGIDQFLKQIMNSKFGKDVRQAIHDGIQQCYKDATEDSVTIDNTLTKTGEAADAKAAGDAIKTNSDDIGILHQNNLDIGFEKRSENLIDESRIYINNAIINRDGFIVSDNRGFRIYKLKVGSGNTVTVSIDKKWFYGIQSDTENATVNNIIQGVDLSTYFDTMDLLIKTQKTIEMEHDFLFLCFFPHEPNGLLSDTTSQIMVNLGSKKMDYKPYDLVISINVQNKRYENILDHFEQAYIKNYELIANEIQSTNGSVAHYTCVEMSDTILSVKAKVKFYGEAFSTFISEPNGMYCVEDITKKCVHINMSRKKCYIGYFDNKQLINTKEIDYDAPEDSEVVVGFEYDRGTNVLTVYTPDGKTYTESNEMYGDCCGKYACWEHYINVTSQEFICNHFNKIYAKDINGNVLCDDFKRANGAVGNAPQGYVYGQFTNLNQISWEL